jgi:parvulin-like peptidyl-prolyl isomerase
MKRLAWRLGLGAAVLSACVACESNKGTGGSTSGGGTASPAAGGGDGPVAKVNGQDITRDTFNRQMERTRQRFAQAKREIPPALEVRLKENIIRKLVDDELINQKAKAEGVSLADTEVDAKLQEHKTRFGSPEAFKSFLERTGQSEADLREELKRTELRDRLFNKLAAVEEPAETEVKEFYEKNLERYKERESVNAIQVFWKSDPKDPADQRKKLEARAKQAATELKKKGVDFKAQIAKYSDATPSPNGGDMGWITRGRQVKDIEDAMFDPKVKAGDVVGPVATQFGYHIVKVVDRKAEKQKPLTEVAQSIQVAIKARKKSEKTRDTLASMKKDAKVEVLEPGVSLEPQPLPAPGAVPMAPGAPIAPNGQPMGKPIQLMPVQNQPGAPVPAPAPAAQPQAPAPAH